MEHGLRGVRDGFPVSVRLLREMHELLLSDVRGQHRRPGELRASPVWIGGNSLADAVFVPPRRSEYYDHLLLTSQRGDHTPWLRFFLHGVRRQARDAEERTVELQHKMRSQLLDEGRPNSVVRLAEHSFSTPILTAPRVESLLGVTRPTAHSAIDALVERGDLHEVTGRERGRIYEAPRIFDAVHGPVAIGDPAPEPQLQLDLEPEP